MAKTSHPLKIVSCCYCGARSTIASDRPQRLVCHGCGAAISKLEPLQPDIERRRKTNGGTKPAIPHQAEESGRRKDKDRPCRRKKGKRRKRSFWYHVREMLDDVDDIFDVFD